jgi:SAM-dependent methyltransferase
VVGIDYDTRRLDIARKALGDEPRVELVEADMRTAELPASDVVACLDVLHYLPFDEQDVVLERVAAAVRPGGTLLIRDADGGAGLRASITRAAENIAVMFGRHKAEGVHLRPANETAETLRRAGLQVEVLPCSEGTPFANMLFVAERPLDADV